MCVCSSYIQGGLETWSELHTWPHHMTSGTFISLHRSHCSDRLNSQWLSCTSNKWNEQCRLEGGGEGEKGGGETHIYLGYII